MLRVTTRVTSCAELLQGLLYCWIRDREFKEFGGPQFSEEKAPADLLQEGAARFAYMSCACGVHPPSPETLRVIAYRAFFWGLGWGFWVSRFGPSVGSHELSSLSLWFARRVISPRGPRPASHISGLTIPRNLLAHSPKPYKP